MENTPSPHTPYTALASYTEAMYEEKRSTFTALLFPVDNREQAMAELARVKSRYPDASHHCWAYLLGPADQPRSQAFNDDGEPSGTAGKPILHVLTQRGASDCLAIVVRTFGGVKLGAGGLVRAYGASVSQALDRAQWRQVTPKQNIRIDVDFAHEERVRHCLEQRQIAILSVDYAQSVTLSVDVPLDQRQDLQAEVQQLTSGNFHWQPPLQTSQTST